ncbi:ferritin-like protein [Streptomyces sp. VNUA74]|uniref:ferritin-like domain-containing protein n=1 Tax=Streptomyces sp. VNUA74 TaxID=3062685 RepID=UPI00280A6C62|nr:ferritin-like protein [Streptomyces sp. VNUA74]WML84236.1 ferritin-like protein [Streptomyces sp. VNUA74]
MASAALTAAAAPMAAAAPVRAADGPASTAGCRSVATLLAVPDASRDVAWLRESLQVAVALELATLPPYLCGWWSVEDRSGQAARLIRRILADEMYHMGVVCNLLVAVGGRPRVADVAPVYPGPLPGGVRSEVTVYLSGLTRPFVHDVMMAIEAPDEPLARSAGASPGIGDFYDALLDVFRTTAPELSARGQLSERIGTDVLEPVTDLDGVERAIGIIKEQGEGTASSPADAFGDDHPAHYYAFGEIYHGRQLRETEDGWQFTGAPVPFPAARPMARVPAGGWSGVSAPVQDLLDRFDTAYAKVLTTLEAAWADGDARTLRSAVRAMGALEAPALRLMETALPDGGGTYGPQFRPPGA